MSQSEGVVICNEPKGRRPVFARSLPLPARPVPMVPCEVGKQAFHVVGRRLTKVELLLIERGGMRVCRFCCPSTPVCLSTLWGQDSTGGEPGRHRTSSLVILQDGCPHGCCWDVSTTASPTATTLLRVTCAGAQYRLLVSVEAVGRGVHGPRGSSSHLPTKQVLPSRKCAMTAVSVPGFHSRIFMRQ